jgi:putative pyruvate formate lyase activating enzyme
MTPAWATAERLAAARRHYRSCQLCEHRCGADRAAGERGPCKAGPVPRVFRHRVEYSEESELVPSHLIYLSGCDLRCVFCISEANAFDPRRGEPLTPEFFRAALAWGRSQGARTLQWVGGEPTVHLPAILDVMAGAPELPRVVWKTDAYGTPAALELLRGVADVYVADFKFGNDACARRLAGVERYTEVVTRNLTAAAGQGELIVRHLLLPGHQECCYVTIVAWLKEHLPGVKFSLRDGFLPRWQARHVPELAQSLAPADGRRALELATASNLRVIV